MHLYKAEILLAGELTNTVIKPDLTAAEILILQTIHGSDAVRGIVKQGTKQVEYQKEYDRLLRTYGRKYLLKVFPGVRPILPEKLADVGIMVQEDGYIRQEVVAKGPNNADRKTSLEKSLEENAVEVDNEPKKVSADDLTVDDEETDSEEEDEQGLLPDLNPKKKKAK